jgi:hypothetical protein
LLAALDDSGVVRGVLKLRDGHLLLWAKHSLLLMDMSSGPLLATLAATLTGHIGEVLGALELVDGHLLSWAKSDPESDPESDTLCLWETQSLHKSKITRFKGLVASFFRKFNMLLPRARWAQSRAPLATLAHYSISTIEGALELANGHLLSWGDSLCLWDRQSGKVIDWYQQRSIDAYRGIPFRWGGYTILGALELRD